jgi:hypothetical protein
MSKHRLMTRGHRPLVRDRRPMVTDGVAEHPCDCCGPCWREAIRCSDDVPTGLWATPDLILGNVLRMGGVCYYFGPCQAEPGGPGRIDTGTWHADCATCEAGGCCSLCNDGTPQTLTLTLTGTGIINGCVADCGLGIESMSGPGGHFDGVYTLVKSPAVIAGVASCCWQATFTTAAVAIYGSSGGCVGAPSGTITTWTISLCVQVPNPGDPPVWTLDITGGASGYFSQLFVATPVLSTGNCALTADLPTFANDCNGVACFGTYEPGIGGTAVVSFEATDTLIAGC